MGCAEAVSARDFLLDGREIVEEVAGQNITTYVATGVISGVFAAAPGLVSEISGTARTGSHPDGHGSIRAMTSGSEDVTACAVYEAYGNLILGSTSEFGYAGQYGYFADATGLDYLKARYYSPHIGRFVSRDPIRHNDGTNIYGYANGNLVLYVDPNGDIAIIIVPVARIAIEVIKCWQSPPCRAFLSCIGAALKVGFEDLYKHIVHGEDIGVSNTLCKAAGACVGSAAGAFPLKGVGGLIGAIIGGDNPATWSYECWCDKAFPK